MGKRRQTTSYGHVHTDSEGTSEAGIYPWKLRSSRMFAIAIAKDVALNLFPRQTMCVNFLTSWAYRFERQQSSTFNSVWLYLVPLSGYPRSMRVYCYPLTSTSTAVSVVKQPHSQPV